MLTAEQVAERKKYLGGSDCAAVLGLSRWKTPLSVWCEKTGQLPDKDLSDSLPIEIGNEMEDLVCRLFTKRTGLKAYRVNETIYHPNYSFLAANIDRRIVGTDSILEAKTCSGWKAKEWEGDEMPQEYLLQCLHYLAVTGKESCWLAVLIGGNQDFKWKEVHRDPKLIADIIKKESEFWLKFVEPKVMPLTITKNDAETLYGLFPHGDETPEIDLGDDAARLCESLEAMKADYKTLEGSIDKTENELKALLKDKAVGMAGQYKVTWKDARRPHLDTKAIAAKRPEIIQEFTKTTTYRRFGVKKTKEAK